MEKDHSGAWVEDIVAAVARHSTFVDSAAVVKSARHTCGVDRVLVETRLKQASWTVEYGRIWEGKDESSGLPP